jgi:hypothetical protein
MTDAIAPEGVVPAENDAETPEVEETNGAEAEEAASAEAEDQDAGAEADDEGGEEGEEEAGEEEAAEEVEFNFNGDKLRLPKGSVPEDLATRIDKFIHSAEAATSRKTQELADQRKAVETKAQALDKLTTLSNEALETYSRGTTLQKEIQQLSQVDLNALWQSNPDQARRVSDVLSKKQQEFAQVVQQVNAKEQELAGQQKAEMERQKQEGAELIERQIKGFKSEHLPAVIDYVVTTLGMDKEAAENDWPLNPVITVAVHKAMLYDRAQAAAKRTSPKPAPAKALKTRKSGAGNNAPGLDTMTAGQMAKYLGLPG